LDNIQVQPLSSGSAEQLPAAIHRGRCLVTDFAPESQPSLKHLQHVRENQWAADFSSPEAASLFVNKSLLGRPRELTLKLSGGASGNVVKVVIGSHFQIFTRTVGILDGEAKSFTFPVPPEGWEASAGKNAKIEYPLRFEGILLERGTGPAQPTTVQLQSFECTTDVPRDNPVILRAEPTLENWTAGKSRFAARCTGWSLLDHSASGTLTTTVRDWERRVLSRAEQPWSIEPNGSPAAFDFQCEVSPNLNFAEVEFQFEAAGMRPITSSCTTTRPVNMPGNVALQPESPWGMGVYLYRYPDNPDGHALMDRTAALAEQAGVKWSREEFSWWHIEHERGNFDFHFYDKVVDTARRHGINVYGLLAYWAPWTKSYTEEGIDDFCSYARTVVSHYKDKIKHWEVYNEPNLTAFWSGPPELYPVLLRKVYQAIKEEDPTAHVLGVSTTKIDVPFIQMCLDKGAPFDILTVHPYRGYFSDTAFMKELREVAELVDNRPVWITEMGYSTQVGGKDERHQAILLARTYLSAAASGACQNISWYDFRNDSADPFYGESNFGVLRHDLAPKPAYRALTMVCRTFDHGNLRQADFGEGIMAVQSGDRAVLWNPVGACRIPLRVTSGSVAVSNLMGEKLHTAQERLELTLLPESPLFLTGGTVEPVGEPTPVTTDIVREIIEL
jgi:hypothetical protein